MPMTARQFANRFTRPAFTLVELLVVMGVLAMLSSLVLVGLSSAAEQARANRTRSQVQKIHELLMPRWESYRYRRVEPMTFSTGSRATPRQKIQYRVDRIRELMRMEMPCRIQDLEIGTALVPPAVPAGTNPPSTTALWNRYRRIVARRAITNDKTIADAFDLSDGDGWSKLYEDAECLYMIIESIQIGETNGLDFFKSSEIGDVDNDGMPEILDAWGEPIHFLRWPYGFFGVRSNLQNRESPDPFDPLNVRGGKTMTGDLYDHFPLYPLVISSGPDGQLDIAIKYNSGTDDNATVTGMTPTFVPNDPYFTPTSGPDAGKLIGEERDTNANGVNEYLDNISNHQLVIAGNSQ